MKPRHYGIIVRARTEQQRNHSVAELRQLAKEVEMPCGNKTNTSDVEFRWYMVWCPCHDTSHILIEVSKALTYGIGEGAA